MIVGHYNLLPADEIASMARMSRILDRPRIALDGYESKVDPLVLEPSQIK